MRLKEKYTKEIADELKKEFGYKNIFEIPKIEKISVNVGFGKNTKDKAYIANVKDTLVNITGQSCVLTKARKSISGFKVREGMIIGAKVTLRGQRMYDFLDKLINVTFPRVRDFRGVEEKVVDKNGNLSVGFKEQLSFPEISPDKSDSLHGLEVSVATTAKSKEEGVKLFKLMGFPFKKAE